jgi:choline-sulfatase
MEPANLILILSDQHSRDASGCYGHAAARTPNIDRLAVAGTRFDCAYTNCPICIPARASLATGQFVHRIGYWDNGEPYDGRGESWHHVVRAAGHRVDAIGKLHFRSTADDNGFTEEVEPLHVVDGVGDVLGCVRDEPPRRHKRGGIEEAGPGDSTYIGYDSSNGERACRWLARHGRERRPWVLFVGFVLPHPPYIAPPELFDLYRPETLPLPPQWKAAEWPSHPVIAGLRSAFDFDVPFPEAVVRRLNAAYYGAASHMDRQVGRVLDAVAELGIGDRTRIIYASDHGESRGARGLFGKFTMYEESAAVPLVMAGPGVPRGRVVRTPVSLVDVFPTVLEAVLGSKDGSRGLPGRSLLEIAGEADADRTVFSEYHALGSAHGYFMVRHGRWKYVHYVGAPPQLFDLAGDPLELHDLAGDGAHGARLRAMEGRLREVVDPDDADARARADQLRVIERFGGKGALIARGAFDNSPVPGEAPRFHL